MVDLTKSEVNHFLCPPFVQYETLWDTNSIHFSILNAINAEYFGFTYFIPPTLVVTLPLDSSAYNLKIYLHIYSCAQVFLVSHFLVFDCFLRKILVLVVLSMRVCSSKYFGFV